MMIDDNNNNNNNIKYNIYIAPRAYFACFQHEFENFCNEVQNISTSVENSMQNMPEGRLMLTIPTGKKRVLHLKS
jgi:hypothetical protein